MVEMISEKKNILDLETCIDWANILVWYICMGGCFFGTNGTIRLVADDLSTLLLTDDLWAQIYTLSGAETTYTYNINCFLRCWEPNTNKGFEINSNCFLDTYCFRKASKCQLIWKYLKVAKLLLKNKIENLARDF